MILWATFVVCLNLWFWQDGAPSHCGIHVRQWSNQQFPDAWIGQRGLALWPPTTPDLTSLNFHLLERTIVYAEKTPQNHLKEYYNNAVAAVLRRGLELNA